MKIGIIGAGNMGSGMGKFWAKNGHELMFSFSRDEEKLKELAKSVSPNASVGTPQEAAKFGDVVLLAVPFGAVETAISQTANELDGKVLFSCVNALKADMSGMAIGTTDSAAELVARLAPKAKVVEALPLFAETLHSDSTLFHGEKGTAFYCGDDNEAKKIVESLLNELNVETADIGGLANARYLEPAMMILIQLAYVQNAGQVAFKLLRK